MIPHYNRVSYLEKTLQSVIDQWTEDLDMEIVVVDDDSKIEPPDQIIKKWAHPNLRLVKNRTNLGQMANINQCIDLARGEWIHILHCDDYVLPGFYAAVQQTAAQFREAGAIFTRHQFVDDQGGVLFKSHRFLPEPGIIPGWFEKIATQQLIQTPSIVVKKSVYRDVGKFDTDFLMCEDWEMWVRISSKFPVVFIPDVLAAYRLTQVSTTTEAFKHGAAIADHEKAIQRIKKYHNNEIIARKSVRQVGLYLYSIWQGMIAKQDVAFKDLWKWQMLMFKHKFMNNNMIYKCIKIWIKWILISLIPRPQGR